MLNNRYNYKNQTGMFRERITLRRRVVRQDALLQQIETFEEYGKYWAMVKTFKNNNEIENGAERTRVQKRYVLKYAKSLDEFISSETTHFEIVHKGVIYRVEEAVNDNDLNSTITIYVEGAV